MRQETAIFLFMAFSTLPALAACVFTGRRASDYSETGGFVKESALKIPSDWGLRDGAAFARVRAL
jgi:hypothetical protein